MRRWLPVDGHWSGTEPDHPFRIKPDLSACCEWHTNMPLKQVRPLIPERWGDPNWDELMKSDYHDERLGWRR
jgi:hypothetical protein